MNPITRMLIDMARFYNYELDERQVELFMRVLSQFPENQVLECGKKYIHDVKNFRFPIPIHRIMSSGEVTDRDVANEMTREIDRAVGRYGWNWEGGIFTERGTYWEGGGQKWGSFKDAVIAELGDVGWHVICSRGGWANVRNSSNEMDEGQFIAQMRDQIESSMRLKKSGVDVTKIELPRTTAKQELGSNGGVLKLLDLKPKELKGENDQRATDEKDL